MTSSGENRRGRTRLIGWIVVLGAAFAVWALLWKGAAMRLDEVVDRMIARVEARGGRAACDGRAIGGFPFTLSLSCASLNYARELDGVALQTGAVSGNWQPLAPLSARIGVDGPSRLELPGLKPLELTWDRLAVALRLWIPRPSRILLAATQTRAVLADEGGAPAFSLDTLDTSAEATGDDLALTLSARGLRIDPGAVGGRDVPALDADGRGTIVNGAPILLARQRTVRGRTIVVEELAVSAEGGAPVSIAGKIAVSAEGRADGVLTARAGDFASLSLVLQRIFPDEKAEIIAGIQALKAIESPPGSGIPVRFVDGQAFLGFMPLGFLPPLP